MESPEGKSGYCALIGFGFQIPPLRPGKNRDSGRNDKGANTLPGEIAAIVPVEQAYRAHSDNRQHLDGEICQQV